MKRLVSVCAVILIVALLSACADQFYTTTSFRRYQSFAERYKLGMDRQDVIDKLGIPDSYRDEEGEYHKVPVMEEDAFKEILLKEGTEFVYTCHKYRDPADPYRLRITFNDEGKSADLEFEQIGGG